MDSSLSVGIRVCSACLEQGRDTMALVRMMPRVAILNGKPVGLEYWGCPVCRTLHFPISAAAKKSWAKLKRLQPNEVCRPPPRCRPVLQVIEGDNHDRRPEDDVDLGNQGSA